MIKLKYGNSCYISVWNLLSSSLLSKNTKIKNKKYITVNLPVVLYGCETSSLIRRKEHLLRVCANRVMRKICGPMRNEVTGEWRRLYTGELNDMYSSPDIVCEIGGACGMNVGTREVDAGFWWGDPRARDYLEDLGVRWEDNIKKGSSRSGMVGNELD